MPHSTPYKEIVSVIPQQRERDGKTHLVEPYCEENQENQQYNPCNQALICSSALHTWRGILQRENEETEIEGYYLNGRGFDRDDDKERILVHWTGAGKKDLGDRWNGGACLSTYCTPPGLGLIPQIMSQRIYDKPAQSRLPRRCLFYYYYYSGRNRQEWVANFQTVAVIETWRALFVPDGFSHFKDQLRGWCWCFVRGKGKGGSIRGGRTSAKNYWEQWWPPGHGLRRCIFGLGKEDRTEPRSGGKIASPATKGKKQEQ